MFGAPRRSIPMLRTNRLTFTLNQCIYGLSNV